MALDRCCFCCKLETGTSILGFMGLFWAIVSIVMFSILLSSVDSVNNSAVSTTLGIFLAFSVIDFFTSIMLIIAVVKVSAALCVQWSGFD